MKSVLLLVAFLVSNPSWAVMYGDWKSGGDERPVYLLRITPRYFIFRDLGRFTVVSSTELRPGVYEVDLFTGRDDGRLMNRGSNICHASVSGKGNETILKLICNQGRVKRVYFKDLLN